MQSCVGDTVDFSDDQSMTAVSGFAGRKGEERQPLSPSPGNKKLFR